MSVFDKLVFIFFFYFQSTHATRKVVIYCSHGSINGYTEYCEDGSTCCKAIDEDSCCVTKNSASFLIHHWYILVALIVLLIAIPFAISYCLCKRKQQRDSSNVNTQLTQTVTSNTNASEMPITTSNFAEPPPSYEEITANKTPKEFEEYAKRGYNFTNEPAAVNVETRNSDEIIQSNIDAVEPLAPPYPGK